MTPAENPQRIVDEMHRKPDAGYLIEWIEELTERLGDGSNTPLDQIADAIAAYREGLEG